MPPKKVKATAVAPQEANPLKRPAASSWQNWARQTPQDTEDDMVLVEPTQGEQDQGEKQEEQEEDATGEPPSHGIKEDATGEPPSHGINRYQRHALRKLEPALPADMKKALDEARADKTVGKQRRLNALMHTLVPSEKYTNFKGEVSLDNLVVRRFREFTKSRQVGVGAQGYTLTELMGPGKLGSKDAVTAGIARGDITMKVLNGKEIYYIAQAHDFTVATDTVGRSAEGKMDDSNMSIEDRESLFANMMSMATEGFAEGIQPWAEWALTTARPAIENTKPASKDAHERIQEAFDGINMKVRDLKKICVQAMTAAEGSSARAVATDARYHCKDI